MLSIRGSTEPNPILNHLKHHHRAASNQKKTPTSPPQDTCLARINHRCFLTAKGHFLTNFCVALFSSVQFVGFFYPLLKLLIQNIKKHIAVFCFLQYIYVLFFSCRWLVFCGLFLARWAQWKSLRAVCSIFKEILIVALGIVIETTPWQCMSLV